MVNNPLVTVIAVCYNHFRFVLECLESIRNQTYENIQLIIMDDCSKDDSVGIIRAWIADNSVNCTFLPHTENKGICRTLNEALTYASGKYISLIATDDVWMLDKIENQVKQMEMLAEDVGVLYSDALQIDEAGGLLPKMFIESNQTLPEPHSGYIASVLIEGNFIPAMTALIRKTCYEKVGFYDEQLCYEDWDMWLRISEHFKFIFSPGVSAKYRIVSTSLSRNLQSMQQIKLMVSHFIIYLKCLTSKRINGKQQKRIEREIIKSAEQIYKLKIEERNRYLWDAFRLNRRFRTLILFTFSICFLPYSLFHYLDVRSKHLWRRFQYRTKIEL